MYATVWMSAHTPTFQVAPSLILPTISVSVSEVGFDVATKQHLLSVDVTPTSDPSASKTHSARRERVVLAGSCESFPYIQNKLEPFKFHSLIFRRTLLRGSRYGVQFCGDRDQKMHSCWRENRSVTFQLSPANSFNFCCYFFPVQVFNLPGRYEGRRLELGGAGRPHGHQAGG